MLSVTYTGSLCSKGVQVFRYYFRLQVYERLGISLVEVYERFLVSRGLFSLFSQVFSGKISNNIRENRPLVPVENKRVGKSVILVCKMTLKGL